MFERFTREAREVVKRSREEALALRSPTVEAEHLLLALADGGGRPAELLAEAGLDRERLIAALDDELVASLEAIGLDGAQLLEQAPPSGWRTPRWGQSAKLALERTLRVAGERGDRRLLPKHILLAVLRAEAGTVRRVLRRADVEPKQLSAALDAD